MQKGTKHSEQTRELIRKGMQNQYKKMTPAERKKRIKVAHQVRWSKK